MARDFYSTKPFITVREFRAHMREVIRQGAPRILGTRWRGKCIIVPVDPAEWYGASGMDKRMKLTRKKFEDAMSHLEH